MILISKFPSIKLLTVYNSYLKARLDLIFSDKLLTENLLARTEAIILITVSLVPTYSSMRLLDLSWHIVLDDLVITFKSASIISPKISDKLLFLSFSRFLDRLWLLVYWNVRKDFLFIYLEVNGYRERSISKCKVGFDLFFFRSLMLSMIYKIRWWHNFWILWDNTVLKNVL